MLATESLEPIFALAALWPSIDIGADTRAAAFLRFLGVFHPFLVHMPIGLIAMAALVEALRLKWKSISPQVTVLCLVVASLGALAAVGAGLARSTSYGDSQLLTNHKWGGIILASCTLIVTGLAIRSHRRRDSIPLDRARVVAVFVLAGIMSLVGHWGAELTHGEAFLSRAWNAIWEPARERPAAVIHPTSKVVFHEHIRPIFESRCYECHGATKSKRDLRLDRREDAMRGGKSGPPWIAGDSANSLILQMLRPEFLEDIMPPQETGNTVSDAEVDLIRRWIDEGANWPP